MKVHRQFARAVWNSSDPDHSCRRPIRPLAPNLHDTVVDLKSFIRADGGHRRDEKNMNSPKDTATMRVTWQQGQGGTGMRWNPAPEQIGILERLYRGGMRTPNAEQIERITAQLSKYGKIEGKNVFYWFQNHKARERQKLKRTHSFATTASSTNSSEEQGSAKKKCVTTWAFDCLIPEETIKISTNANYLEHQSENEEELGSKKTLELFPLHPEGINCNF